MRKDNTTQHEKSLCSFETLVDDTQNLEKKGKFAGPAKALIQPK